MCLDEMRPLHQVLMFEGISTMPTENTVDAIIAVPLVVLELIFAICLMNAGYQLYWPHVVRFNLTVAPSQM
jgi:hypothetical protein